MEETITMLKIDNVSKEYKLGQIGGTTLRDELQRLNAKIRHKEDPTKRIGAKNYNKGEIFKALDGVSFEVKKGERVGIIGHNGAGKSTLLKLISRVTAPTSGEIGLNGRVASMLEVGTGFHGELTGRENIYMNGAILGMTKKEIDSKIEDIIEFSECRQFIDTPVKRYSSGMYVKLAFSVAAHLDSEIMIMDEVLAVGDMAFQKKCIEKMNDVSRSQGRTILYVSHNLNTIRQLCDRVIVLDHGKLIFDADVEGGINTYLDTAQETPPEVDLTTFDRPIKHGTMGYCVAQKIKITNYSKWSVPVGSKLQYELIVKCNKKLENVGYRTRIFTTDGRPITVFVAPNAFSCEYGDEITLFFEADTSYLVPGKYFMTIAIYGVDEYGTWSFYDHVHSAVCFEITNVVGFNNNMPWETFFWGNVKLPEIAKYRDNIVKNENA